MSEFTKLISSVAKEILTPKQVYCLKYYHHRGHYPNLEAPDDMSEILLSQMFEPSNKMCIRYASYIDKLGVRDYVKTKGLENILLEHYGIWNTPEEIPFDKLPNKFVLKSNNGCAHHVICHDKTKLDIKQSIKTLNEAIISGKNSLEPHYHYIEPKVYAEELIETADGAWPVDYKFTCIGGEIVDIFVAVDRATKTKYCTLDLNWKPLPYIREEYAPNKYPPKPLHLDEMIKVAKVLSKDFEFVRVDLYEYRNQPYISELTFFPWGGLMYGYTNEALKIYGEKWRDLHKSL